MRKKWEEEETISFKIKVNDVIFLQENLNKIKTK
jgi:hypothetical protein